MIKIIIFFLLGTALLIAYVKYIEYTSVFFPSREIDATPSSLGLDYEELTVTLEEGVRVHGWFIPSDTAQYTLFFCHGNGGNISHRLQKFLLLRESEVNICIFDYRGYGKSTGSPSERGVYRDAEAVYRYLVNERNIPPEKIVLYGESLGGAVALDLATKVTVGALILEGTFSSGRDMAKRIYPFLPAFLFSNLFDSLSKIADVKVPILFIHSRDDDMVPFDLAQKLYARGNEPKYFTEIQGDHNAGFLDSQKTYSACIRSFIEKF